MNESESQDCRTRVSGMYDALADQYDARWARYVESTARATAEALDLWPEARLLDVGCGSGALLEHLGAAHPDAGTVGIDISHGMLARARARLGPRPALCRADAARLPFRTASFDVITSISSLHYWHEPGRTFDELARALRPEGRLVITDWCLDASTIRLTDLYLRIRQKGYRRAYRSTELREFLENRGFVVSIRRFRTGRWWGMMTAVARHA